MKIQKASVVCVGACMFLLGAADGYAQYIQSNLVANRTGLGAPNIDSRLLDPWGIVQFPGGPFAVANTHSGVITFYTPTGSKLPLEITVPPAPGSPTGTPGSPTGIVLNLSPDFVIRQGGRSAPALLIVDTLDGIICGWNPLVDSGHAVIVVDNSAEHPFPASYTALTLARNRRGQNILYAADSGSGPTTSNNRIDMFSPSFAGAGHFSDSNIPAGMTVFGVQSVDSRIYVAFAGFSVGQGGVIDAFDTEGSQTPGHFASNAPGGPLEEPWGVVAAPHDFGKFGDALLIGNFTDGRVSAYEPASGHFLGQLADRHGTPLANGGLWGMVFGAADLLGEKSSLFFAAGLNSEADGLFGAIRTTDREE